MNPQNTSSLLFRYNYNDQFINLVSNVADIQQLLKLPQRKTDTVEKTDSQTITKQTERNINTNNTQIVTKIDNTATNTPSIVTTSMIVTSKSTSVSGTSNNNQDNSGAVSFSEANLNLVPVKLQ